MLTEIVLDNGARLPLSADSRIAFTGQENNILKPDSVQATFSTTFQLEDSREVSRKLEDATIGTSATNLPYSVLPCAVDQDGRELLPKARAIIEAYEQGKGVEGQVLSGNKNFYALIEGKSLRDLDLSQHDHLWNLNSAFNVNALGFGWRNGYCYDFYDRGKGGVAEGGNLNLYNDGVFPSIYLRRIWEQIFTDVGVRWRGELPAMFDKLLLPTTAVDGYGEDFRERRKLIAGVDSTRHADEGRPFQDRGPFIKIVPYDITPAELGYVAPTEPLVYDRAAGGWRAKEWCFVRMQATLPVRLDVRYGKATARLNTMVNGVQLRSGDVVTWERPDDDARTVGVSEEKLLLKTGDLLQVQVELRQGSGSNNKWGYDIFKAFDGGTVIVPGFPPITIPALPPEFFRVEVLPDFPPNGLLRLQDLLPDWEQKDFVKACIGLFGLSQHTDPYADEVTFQPAATALAKLAQAPAWDDRQDLATKPRREWHLSGIGRRNYFRWKEDKTNSPADETLGDGYLPCSDYTLAEEEDLLEMPWAATSKGTNGLLLLPVYKVREGVVNPGAPKEYDRQKPVARLVVQTERVRNVKLRISHMETRNGQQVEVIDQEGPAFAPISIFADQDEAQDLDFTRSILPRYYPHLAAVLRRPLKLEPSVRLREDEFSAFDYLQPIWLESEGHYFWVNKIVEWGKEEPLTKVELLRLTL